MDKLWLLSTSILLLAWLINEWLPHKRPPIVNHGATIYFNSDVDLNPNGPLYLIPTKDHPDGLYVNTNLLCPRTKEEIIWIIKSVAATQTKSVGGNGNGHGRRIRIIGSGHSWSKVAKSDDIQLSLEDYKGIVSIDKDKLEVTVRGGTTLNDLNSMLEVNGLALKILGSISDQTVAGAVSTATHGSGVEYANMATIVIKLELINGEGDVLTLTPQDNQDVFKAAQVSIGLFGVISEVTFQCVPAFNLVETRYTLPLHTCLDNIKSISSSGQHVKFWTELYTEKCIVYVANRTNESPRDNPNHFLQNLQNHLFEIIVRVDSWFPSTIPWIMNFVFNVFSDPFPPYNRVDKSYNVFNIPHYVPLHHEAELIVDINYCAAAIREQKKLVFEKGFPVNFLTEVRFVKSDDIWLSPNYKRDSCHITLTITSPQKETSEQYFFGFYQALHLNRFEPRVHWGKDFNVIPEEMQSVYPKLSEFLTLRKKMDPYGIFLNELLIKSMGI